MAPDAKGTIVIITLAEGLGGKEEEAKVHLRSAVQAFLVLGNMDPHGRWKQVCVLA